MENREDRDWDGMAMGGEELGLTGDLGSHYTGNASVGSVEEPPLRDFPGRNFWAEFPGI